ncbi:MAG: cytochrome c oxidase subunit 3 [Bacteroidetes bacterium]|nr:cytochrome c oxidase subunit 3 [Bacteroidota bacterium]
MSTFDIDPKINAKAKKNLLWFGIFSVIMIFAGLTSAYVVSKGSVFWVEFKKPADFIWSTVMVVLGSLLLILATRSVKKENYRLVKIFTGGALLTGILFSYFQWTGWTDLSSRGNALNTPIVNSVGKYGLFYSLSYEGKEITFDGYDFYYQGDVVSTELKGKMVAFCKELMDGSKPQNREHKFELTDYGTGFALKYQNQLVTYLNGQMQVGGLSLTNEMHDRLYRFAESIVNNRGDFMISGRFGEDFKIHYKDKELTYQNRKFYLGGLPLSAKQESDLNGAENQASAYTFAFVFVHLFHVIGGLVALLVIWIRSIQVRYTSGDYLGIQLGSIYWHFLGILWIYLYAFLIFIH